MRTAAEIDAAKAVLTTTDLGAVTSEVRQFPPGYVTGGRLKLNTNLQIEVAPIAINVAGKDVRTADTTIIGNEHWMINGVETPRVPGSWYYLYLSTAGQFAVSPNEPVYNALYFAYYHAELQDLRAIGKFYFGDAGTVVYTQTSLESASAQVLVASSTYTGEDAHYYCLGTKDEVFINIASKYLASAFGRGEIHLTSGIFYQDDDISLDTNISLIGETGATIYSSDYTKTIANTYGSDTDIRFQNIIFQTNLGIVAGTVESKAYILNNTFTGNLGRLGVGCNNAIVANNIFLDTAMWGIHISGDENIVIGNNIKNCSTGYDGFSYGGIYIANANAVGNIIQNNFVSNCGNIINRCVCDSSSTSPWIYGTTYGVTASNATWGFTSTGPYEGTGQYRFTKTVAAGTIAYLHLVDNVGAADLHSLIPGTRYEWGGWIKVDASASCGYQGFRIYQATTGAGAASAVAWTTATIGWQWVAVTSTIYVNATTAYIGLVASASLATMSFDVDLVRLFAVGKTNAHNKNYYNGGTDTYDGL